MTTNSPEPRDNLTDSDRREIEAMWNSHPGMLHMGARLALTEPGRVRAILEPVRPQHRGGLGTEAVNGAVIAGLFDLVVGLTGYVYTRGRRAGVAQLHIHYIRPVMGNRVEVIGWPVRVGLSLVFVAAELRDEQNVICAHADGIVAVSGGHREESPAKPTF